MCAKLVEKGESRIEVLANQLERQKIFDERGAVEGFQGFETHIYITALESYFLFNEQIPIYERYFILYRALASLAKKQKLTAKGILGSLCKEENFYLNRPKEKFILASSISIKYFDEIKKANGQKSKIKFTKSLAKKFDRGQAIETWKQYDFGEIPESYTIVQIPVYARSEHEAYKIAIDELDLIRGIWNLYLSEYVISVWSKMPIEPISKVRLGPIHTLHFPDGKTATNGIFWYEQDFVKTIYDIKPKWEKIRLFEHRIRRFLTKHPYKNDMKDALIRYVRALDYKDFHATFLELWILLEKLTATENAQYENMVNKVAFLFEDAELHKQILQHLRIYRNSNIHTGQRNERVVNYIYQLKAYVEQLIEFHVANRFKFQSLKEAAIFLDLPTKSALLKDRIKSLQSEIKLINKGIAFRLK